MADVIQKIKQKVVSLPSPLVQGIAGFFSGFIVDYVVMEVLRTTDFDTWTGSHRIPVGFSYWWLWNLYHGKTYPEHTSVALDDFLLEVIVPLLFLVFKRNMLIFGVAFAIGSYVSSALLS